MVIESPAFRLGGRQATTRIGTDRRQTLPYRIYVRVARQNEAAGAADAAA